MSAKTISSLMNDLMDGSGDVLHSITAVFMGRMDSLKLAAKAQAAHQKGALDDAIRLWEESVSMLGDGMLDVTTRVDWLTNLGAAYAQKGDKAQAEERLKEAVKLAVEIEEAYADSSSGVTAHFSYAWFLRDAGRHDEAMSHYRLGQEARGKQTAKFSRLFEFEPESLAHDSASILSEYLKLLEAMDRRDEANEVKLEITGLNELAARWQKKRKQHHPAFLEGINLHDANDP